MSTKCYVHLCGDYIILLNEQIVIVPNLLKPSIKWFFNIVLVIFRDLNILKKPLGVGKGFKGKIAVLCIKVHSLYYMPSFYELVSVISVI